MQAMATTLSAEDVLPLVASLPAKERVRLLRMMASAKGSDAEMYGSAPPSADEFSSGDDPLAWDSEGWEQVG